MAKGGSRLGAGRPAHKLKAENASALDVAYLSRHGHLDAGNWKRLYWRQYGEVRLEGLVKAFDDHITVDIGFNTLDRPDTDPMSLRWTPPLVHLSTVRQTHGIVVHAPWPLCMQAL